LNAAQYLPYLEKKLTPGRLKHSLGVMQVMGELADIYAISPEQALTTGLIHDIAKDLTPAQQAGIIPRANIEISHECERDYSYHLHGPVGAYLAETELGVSDPVILNAIRTHTYYGNAATNDPSLCWCLRFADILEPSRNWQNVRWLRKGVPRLREVVYGGHLLEGALLQTGWLIQWFREDGAPLHPNMSRIYQELVNALQVDDAFLE